MLPLNLPSLTQLVFLTSGSESPVGEDNRFGLSTRNRLQLSRIRKQSSLGIAGRATRALSYRNWEAIRYRIVCCGEIGGRYRIRIYLKT